ncbi:hypothetical protein NO357_08535 [Marimonas arenosa]|uniref:Uncharacterized protein n=1 Tax=Marimonas arenosa TaxID=1795305 RepID=A0AAE3WC67_9RHOB|nr:hypothetical protein [Marimonas arenosa]
MGGLSRVQQSSSSTPRFNAMDSERRSGLVGAWRDSERQWSMTGPRIVAARALAGHAGRVRETRLWLGRSYLYLSGIRFSDDFPLFPGGPDFGPV